MPETEIVFVGGITEGPRSVGEWPDPSPPYVRVLPPKDDPERPVERYVLSPEHDHEGRPVYEFHMPSQHGQWPVYEIPAE